MGTQRKVSAPWPQEVVNYNRTHVRGCWGSAINDRGSSGKNCLISVAEAIGSIDHWPDDCLDYEPPHRTPGFVELDELPFGSSLGEWISSGLDADDDPEPDPWMYGSLRRGEILSLCTPHQLHLTFSYLGEKTYPLGRRVEVDFMTVRNKCTGQDGCYQREVGRTISR